MLAECPGGFFGFQFVRKLSQLVEIDTRFEPKGVRLRLWRRAGWPARGVLPKARTDRPVDNVLEWQALFPRALLQKPRQIIINGKSGAH